MGQVNKATNWLLIRLLGLPVETLEKKEEDEREMCVS
jgi:hypothetical protein